MRLLWGLIECSDNLTNENAIVKNYAAFFDRTEVTNLVLTNAVLIVCDEVKLTRSVCINSNCTNKGVFGAVYTKDDFISCTIKGNSST